MVQKVLVILALFILITEGSYLKMPSFAFTGESVTMECTIDHGDIPILLVTWEKDGQKFYTYDPNNPDPVAVFNATGVQVKKDLSLTGHSITLGSVSLESSGIYSCKVEIDHPDMDVGEMSGTLKIVRSY